MNFRIKPPKSGRNLLNGKLCSQTVIERVSNSKQIDKKNEIVEIIQNQN